LYTNRVYIGDQCPIDILKQFEFNLCCAYNHHSYICDFIRNNGQRWAVDVGTEAEFPEADLEEGYMLFTNEEILQCFNPAINEILEMMDNQVVAIEAQDKKLQVFRFKPKLLNTDSLTLQSKYY
jgi:hypothetical protein